jgi:hypothetical protein
VQTPNNSPRRQLGSRRPGRRSRGSPSKATHSSSTTPSPATGGGTEQAAASAREGVRTLSETTTGLLGTATGAVGATVEGAERAAEAAVFPIEGYDDMNVDEISKHLDDLSMEELQLVRDYEELNKRRQTLLEQMDRKIRAT